MTKQEAINTRNLLKAQIEWAVNQLGLTLGADAVLQKETVIHVYDEEQLNTVLSAFSFEESYIEDIDWKKGWRGMGFDIVITHNIPAPFMLA